MEIIWAVFGAMVGAFAVYQVVRRRTADELPRDQIKDTVLAAASEALRANSEQFVQLARSELERVQTAASTDLEKRELAIAQLVKPIRDGLTTYQEQLTRIEKERTETFGQLSERLKQLGDVNDTLRKETHALSESLKSTTVRGIWGEIVLERVVELAGMSAHCDFDKQASFNGESGRLRPDLLVKLPGGRRIAVDAKAPLSAYVEAMNCTDEVRRGALLAQHARAVREHAKSLGRKEYWSQFERSPEFVVMFLPGEAFYAAALKEDPTLIEAVMSDKVILASPTSLIALLKAAAYGWQQEAVAESAAEIQKLGRELYERIEKFTEHLGAVGSALEKATKSYNSAVGSFDTRVVVSARKMKDLGSWAVEEIGALQPLEMSPRLVQSGPELVVIETSQELPA